MGMTGVPCCDFDPSRWLFWSIVNLSIVPSVAASSDDTLRYKHTQYWRKSAFDSRWALWQMRRVRRYAWPQSADDLSKQLHSHFQELHVSIIVDAVRSSASRFEVFIDIINHKSQFTYVLLFSYKHCYQSEHRHQTSSSIVNVQSTVGQNECCPTNRVYSNFRSRDWSIELAPDTFVYTYIHSIAHCTYMRTDIHVYSVNIRRIESAA